LLRAASFVATVRFCSCVNLLLVSSFFNAQNQSTGWTYIRPRQTDVPCVTFANATVTGYNGVTMLTDVPANLLDWADNDGNVAYEGFTEDDTF
jgi:hypothetical protein